jgi:hypothetical protein
VLPEPPGSDAAVTTTKAQVNEFLEGVNRKNAPSDAGRSEAVAGIEQRASRIFSEATDNASALAEPSRWFELIVTQADQGQEIMASRGSGIQP